MKHYHHAMIYRLGHITPLALMMLFVMAVRQQAILMEVNMLRVEVILLIFQIMLLLLYVSGLMILTQILLIIEC